MDRHLRGAVEHSVRNTAAYQLRTAPVLYYKGVDAVLGGVFDILAEISGFIVGNDSIHRKIELCAVPMAELCGFGYPLLGEVIGTASRGKALSAYVYSLSARSQSRTESFHAACGSEYLGFIHQMLSLSCLSLTIFSSCVILDLSTSISF